VKKLGPPATCTRPLRRAAGEGQVLRPPRSRSLNMKSSVSAWHVGVAAEAIAAVYFARTGFDISVQYGANQPEYDLIVASGEQLLKVSVKGSQDGSWGLCQSYLTPETADYGAAIHKWLQRHKARTVLCLVQFRGSRWMRCHECTLRLRARLRIDFGKRQEAGGTQSCMKSTPGVHARMVPGPSRRSRSPGNSRGSGSSICSGRPNE
jgi:Holliday junction resolvase-like predicted endonuclease